MRITTPQLFWFSGLLTIFGGVCFVDGGHLVSGIICVNLGVLVCAIADYAGKE